ncbi:hypothetical protein J5226_03025 [Lysobacter sp. K5869]|uniref:hypothetical protein n=1 Tax=Lysobacter sp. K5869 TaxID=2820808 RepID=UPI001C063184|nr:hypothetical protein [Lysobacter sp. K5869]QWP77395.1 hypothetical protein J5226_03025 [Lysobacter sp. K5869]
MPGTFERLEPKILEGLKYALIAAIAIFGVVQLWREDNLDERSPKWSVAALRAQFDGLAVPDGARAVGPTNGLEKGILTGLDQTYSIPRSRAELFDGYSRALAAQGWRQVENGPAAIAFCRQRVRLSVALLQEQQAETVYRLSLNWSNQRHNRSYCAAP